MRSVPSILEDLGVRAARGSGIIVESLPFASGDITAGSESELQAVVIGDKASVDLPLQIEHSNYYDNVGRRVAAGDTPQSKITSLDRYLNDNLTRAVRKSNVLAVRLPR